MAKGVSIIGSGIQAAQCALTLAEMGVEVNLFAPGNSLSLNGSGHNFNPSHEELHLWPLLLKAGSHPGIKIHTNTRVQSIAKNNKDYVINAHRKPRFVNESLCTGCGDCEAECSVKITSSINGEVIKHTAIHTPIPGMKSVPSAFFIEKGGISPCRAKCPLGINVQGYIALAGKGKYDKARELINQTAPMSGILGRLCTHPCESQCSRQKVDSPVFIKSIHRYVADSNTQEIKYERKAPAHSKPQKIAIIGSGPSGLAAAWELARRGYTPTVIESHSVIGGMLATGIPRFRLPREIREKEVAAIMALGVEFRTGVRFGTDITYTDLLDQDFEAFFLSIGANQNNKLNVPGENYNGVLDCISLLFALNIKVGFSEQSEVIVIGGGNSAVDSARSAKRVSTGDVHILCLTEKMTAVDEDVEEAVKEGIIIHYNVNVTEILGEDGRVKGVCYQNVKNVTFEPDGKINMDVITGSEKTLKADHVVVAIGQKPNARNLNMKRLKLGKSSTIVVDPLTLQTNIPGVFAGGDCVTGSNNVVSAMAAGLRAAESIDRFLNRVDCQDGRTLEPPTPVELDITTRTPSPNQRGQMPSLDVEKRRQNYEETNLGFTEEMVRKEAERCLNCAVCCECMECVDACKLNAVNHNDCESDVVFNSDRIINFYDELVELPELSADGVINIKANNGANAYEKISEAASFALSTAFELQSQNGNAAKKESVKTVVKIPGISFSSKRTGVFLCRCGESISSVIDFKKVAIEIARHPDVVFVREIPQSCTEEGSSTIRKYVLENNISNVVLAACRCCNMEQICFSCTDRRVMCQNNLNVDLPSGVKIDFVNIREQCAWLHKADPEGATNRAVELIKTGIIRVHYLEPHIYETRSVADSALIISTGLAGISAAVNLVGQVGKVTLVTDTRCLNSEDLSVEYIKTANELLSRASAEGVLVINWPKSIELNGMPGKYNAEIETVNGKINLEAGVVILDLLHIQPEQLVVLAESNLISRIMSKHHYLDRDASLDSSIAHSYTIRETAGFFIVAPVGNLEEKDLTGLGVSTAARALSFLNNQEYKPRASAVSVNTKLCRACGDCIKMCPIIEMRTNNNGIRHAYVEPALCYGCGACMSVCPTGAIMQPLQSETSIMVALESLLKKSESVGETNG